MNGGWLPSGSQPHQVPPRLLTNQYKTYILAAMARPREFDEAAALDRAMEVFWKQGYQNTSLDDLLEAMGIQRGSFYNTFGSKRETYLRAIDRYVEIMADGGATC